MRFDRISQLAGSITRSTSKQAYLTVRFLVDRDRVPGAYEAYAYFRWLDDRLDRELVEDSERIAFVDRQSDLMNDCFTGKWPFDASIEERMLVDLIQGLKEKNSGLEAYIRNMMVVMSFDARRRGRLVSRWELDRYTYRLAVAVTEALHYFVGHGSESPHGEARYLAASGAHVIHMLRDSLEDTAAGYYNIPQEYLEMHAITPEDICSDAYRAWVKDRVRLARGYFKAGRDYLSQVQNLRCRLAGYAYMARFEGVLGAIQREDYQLKPHYSMNLNLNAGLSSALRVLWSAFTSRPSNPSSSAMLVDPGDQEGFSS